MWSKSVYRIVAAREGYPQLAGLPVVRSDHGKHSRVACETMKLDSLPYNCPEHADH
jgi:hypothetical protein